MTVPTAVKYLKATAEFDYETNPNAPTPFVSVTWLNNRAHDSYIVKRDGVQVASVLAFKNFIPFNVYHDATVAVGGTYTYTVQAVQGGVTGPGVVSKVIVPLYPYGFAPVPAVDPDGGVRKWTFTDVYQKSIQPYSYTMQINPNDGGSPTFEKSLTPLRVTGPNMMPLLQEGSPGQTSMSFSGVILSQAQLETMEIWFRKRILLLIQDDLGRRFYGVFGTWNPKRARRSSNPWYHTYDATFAVIAYYNASGQRIYGRFL